MAGMGRRGARRSVEDEMYIPVRGQRRGRRALPPRNAAETPPVLRSQL